jgi:hypothetical protein
MKRLQFLVPDERAREIDDLVKRTGLPNRTDLLNNALTLLEWAVRERENGRIIGSIDEQAERYKEVELPGFPPVGKARVYEREHREPVPAKVAATKSR